MQSDLQKDLIRVRADIGIAFMTGQIALFAGRCAMDCGELGVATIRQSTSNTAHIVYTCFSYRAPSVGYTA